MTTTFERSLVLLLFALAAAMSVATTTDPDLWWHLRTGQVIVEDGIPSVDIFSYTVDGTDWVTHEWGSQVLMWALWSWGGAAALIMTFTAMITATFVVAYRTSRARPFVTALMVLLAAAAARIATAPRPQMVNLLFLALLVFLLERIRAGAYRPALAWVAVPLVVVWANLHSGYLLGVVVLGVYTVGERLERRRPGGRPLPREAVAKLPLVAAAAFAGAAVNPSGIALWTYPLETLRSPAMRTHIREWQSPDFHSSWFWPFGLLLVVTVVSLVASRRRPGWTQLLLLLGTGLAGLQSMRHIPLFAVVAIPVVAEQLEVAWDGLRLAGRRRSRLVGSRPVAALTAGLAGVTGVMFVTAAIDANDRAVAELYPVDAVDRLLDSELAEARGYNAYGWGGYLIWRDLPVFIDGRADVYGDEFMDLYFQAEDARPDWREPLDTFAVDYVLLPPSAALGVILEEAADWTSVYDDGIAEVFVRCVDDCPDLR